MFARRAAALGTAGVAVVGGDHSVGPERCVPHSKDLRARLREDQPAFPLGGWANPHRDPVEQARFVAADDFGADFVLTQIVSHHSLGRVERFRAELDRLGVDLPRRVRGVPVPERESAHAPGTSTAISRCRPARSRRSSRRG